MSLKICRKAKNITIKEMVALLGIDRKTYYNWETKNRDIPSSMLTRIADILDCSLNDILDYYPETKEKYLSQTDMDQDNLMELSAYLQKKREELKVPRRIIADKLCITPQALRDIELGKTRLSLEAFLVYCEELGLSPMQLIQKTNEHYILLSDDDIHTLEKSIDILTKIRRQASSGSSGETITIGDGNTIQNSFNRK